MMDNKINFAPIHVHSHYSLLDGLSKPEDIARRLVNCGYKSCALTDHGSVSGVVDFASALKDACKHCGYQEKSHDQKTKKCLIKDVVCDGYEKAKLKPIFGCEMFLCEKDISEKTPENRKNSHLCVLARNIVGWKSLIKLVSKSNSRDNFYYKPRTNLDELSKYAGNLIGFSGHPGSDLANVLFLDIKSTYNANSLDQVRMLLKPDWEKQANDLAGKYQDIFGKENFFIEIQMIDRDNLPASIGIAKCLRKIAKNLNIPCVATPDSHYSFKEQASDQRVLLCSELDTTLPQVEQKLKNAEDFSLSTFFKSNNYHIPSIDEMLAVEHENLELQNAFLVSEMCDKYDIENKPFLPNFIENASEKLFEESYNGLTNKGLNTNSEYINRFQKEIRVLNEANLADYFLIVQDYVKWAKTQKIPVGISRGSTGGSLIAYLMGITELDPIPAKLIFERFYNDGRNSKDKVSLPDIDMDFSKNGRKKVIEYIRSKYGDKKVCGITTFNKLKGRGALKAVFSAYGKITFDQMNLITSLIPEPSKISGEIQETIDEFGEASLIEYAIENEKKLKEYCYFDENGELQGDFSKEFSQAIRLEDTKTHMGKHAAGIIISSMDLDDICPMVSDSKGTTLLCGYEMGAAEKVGLVKFDILGIAALDKLKAVNDLISIGNMERVELD